MFFLVFLSFQRKNAKSLVGFEYETTRHCSYFRMRNTIAMPNTPCSLSFFLRLTQKKDANNNKQRNETVRGAHLQNSLSARHDKSVANLMPWIVGISHSSSHNKYVFHFIFMITSMYYVCTVYAGLWCASSLILFFFRRVAFRFIMRFKNHFNRNTLFPPIYVRLTWFRRLPLYFEVFSISFFSFVLRKKYEVSIVFIFIYLMECTPPSFAPNWIWLGKEFNIHTVFEHVECWAH